MKKYILLFLVVLLFSCQNEEWEFPDFDYTTSYFPYQYPIRTIVLGEYNFDNSRDMDGKFLISAAMGGVYENKEDIFIDFAIDESLVGYLYNGDANQILPMPRHYYSLNHDHQIKIPKGEFSGGVDVQLSDEFFNDPKSISTTYVIPLKILSTTTDSILRGKSSISNPDPRIASHWDFAPKDFTLFAVNFVNEYHGRYLLRGKSTIKGLNNTPIETIRYSRPEVEQDEVVSLLTSARRKVTYKNAVRRSGGSPGEFQLELSYDESGKITILNTAESIFEISGNGQFVKDGDEWGGKKRNVIYIDYVITENSGVKHEVNDTLVFRDKAVSFKQFNPVIKRPY